MRLRGLEHSVATWAMPEMFAGVAQQGAVGAWYQVAMDIEEMAMDGTNFCGGAADIHKFSDQILRPLVYMFVEAAGMLLKVLNTYKQFVEALLIYNTIAGGMGRAFRGEMAYHRDARYQ